MVIVAAAIVWSHRPEARFFLRDVLDRTSVASQDTTLGLHSLTPKHSIGSPISMPLWESRCEDVCS